MNLLWQFFCMMAFGGACWAIGDLFRRCFLDDFISIPLVAQHALAFTIGNVVFSYLLTAIGFFGYFIPSVLWAVFIVGSVLAVCSIIVKFKKSLKGPSTNRVAHEERVEKWIKYFLVAIIGFFLLPAILQAAAPPYVRDSMVYHLLCPKEYLKAGRLIHIQGNLFSAFPKGHEVLMTLLLAVAGDRAAQGFSILQQVAAVGGLYSLARLVAGSLPSALCTLGYATIPPVIYFTGCGYVEPALLMTLVNSLLVLVFFFQHHLDKSTELKIPLRAIVFLGFLAGWMPAIKYSGLIYLGLIGLFVLWSERKTQIKKALKIYGAFILGMMPGLCWMMWNWLTLGNPVYPMAWFIFGGKGWSDAQALAMSIYLNAYGMGKSLVDYLQLPWRLAFVGRFDSIRFDGPIGPFLILFLALAAAQVYLLIRDRLAVSMNKQIGLMLIISAAFFLFGTQQARFWLPSQMLACAFAAPALDYLLSWTKNRHLIKTVIFVIVMGSLIWNMWFLGRQALAIGYWRPVLGVEQESDFLRRKVPGYPALEFINENLPESVRLICIWTGAYGYYLNRPYYSDTFIEDVTFKKYINTPMNGKKLSQKLSETGFTHIYLNVPLTEKNMTPEQFKNFNDFLKMNALELFRYQDYSIFKISP